MRIVITGASGNVGTALLSRLAASGEHELVGLSRRRPPAAPPYDSAEWVCADIGEAGARSALRPVFTGAAGVPHLVHQSSIGAYGPGHGCTVDETGSGSAS